MVKKICGKYRNRIKEPEINREIYGHASSRLIRNLKNNGVSAKDVKKVVLTQLHFDHSGGSTSLDREEKLIQLFKKQSI